MKQWSRRLGGTLQKITSGRKRCFVFSKWIIFFFIYTGDRCVQSRRCFAGPKVEVCGILLHERTAFYQQLFSGFLFLSGWWRWGELFSPQAAQLGLACWQRTGDSSNFLIQHFSDASWRNPHPGSALPFFVVSFLQTLVCWGGGGHDILRVQLTQCIRRIAQLGKINRIKKLHRKRGWKPTTQGFFLLTGSFCCLCCDSGVDEMPICRLVIKQLRWLTFIVSPH